MGINEGMCHRTLLIKEYAKELSIVNNGVSELRKGWSNSFQISLSEWFGQTERKWNKGRKPTALVLF